jgi:hypothetical protein
MSFNGTHDVDPLTPRRRAAAHTPHGSLSYSKAQDSKIEKERKDEYLRLASQSQVNLPVEDDYPHGIKLAVLTLALCLSVFLVALVSPA